MLFFKLLRESYSFAVQSIVGNKTRTFLSLLGITIGIFSVIAILTAFDSIQYSIQKDLESMGSNVLFIQKYPMIGGPNLDWAEIQRRPVISYKESEEIKKRSNLAEYVAYQGFVRGDVKHAGLTYNQAGIIPVSEEYDKVVPITELNVGRYISSVEFQNGSPVCVIGSKIFKQLFTNENPLGKEILFYGRKATVIGVFKDSGKNTLGSDYRNTCVIPINFGLGFLDIKDIGDGSIIVKAKKGISNDDFSDELTGVMRAVRKLKPAQKSNFEVVEMTAIQDLLNNIFGVISVIGWIIGGFSLLVGGFGIANIMYVSVKERTGQIGIQKSLGAKNNFILQQFLFEAIFLSLLGGVLGLLVVWGGAVLATYLFKFDIILSLKNIAIGIVVSAAIGLLSGILPAWKASKLDPVEAMRTTF